MEYFTQSRPNLISDKLSGTLEHTLDELRKKNPSVSHHFYENIFLPNKNVFIAIFIIGCILLYLYCTRREKFAQINSNTQIIEATLSSPNNLTSGSIINPNFGNYSTFSGMDDPNSRFARPTFNPYYPVSQQTSYVNYLPDHVPVNNEGMWKNNVSTESYIAPPLHQEIQYSGPFYRGNNTVVSDDGYQSFAQLNNDNLNQFDELIRQKQL